jgi:hypothetical protein
MAQGRRGKPARAVLQFECHNGRCAVQRLHVMIQEGHRAGVKLFQNPVKCVRCGEPLVFTQVDAR